jgi:hypothetical protein
MELNRKRQILFPEKRGSRSPEAFRAAAEAVVASREVVAPQGHWTVEFKMPDGSIISETFYAPEVAVEIVKAGKHYKVKAAKMPHPRKNTSD